MKAVACPTESAVLSISVIVPIFNEERYIGRTLEGILAQDYPADALEILLVDGGSNDGTRGVIKQYCVDHPQVHLLDNPRRWSSSARNIGVQSATGSVVVIVDGHCEFDDDQYFRHIAEAFQDESVQCLGRPQPLDATDGSDIQRAIGLARRSLLGHHPKSFIYSDQNRQVPAHSVAVAYRKSVFDCVGQFDETFDACEDVEFNHRVDRAGLNCQLIPSIRLRYCPRRTVRDLFKQMARYGRGRIRLLRKHGDTFSISSLLPAIFLACLVFGSVTSVVLPNLLIPFLAVVGMYLSVVLAYSLFIAFRSMQPRLAWLLPWVFVAIHFGAGYGSLKELVLGHAARDPFDR